MSRAEGAPLHHEPSLSRSIITLSNGIERGIWHPLRTGVDTAEAIRVVQDGFGTRVSHSAKIHPIVELYIKDSIQTATLLTTEFTLPPDDFIQRRLPTVSASWDYGILSTTTTGGEVGSYSTVLQSPRPGAQKIPDNLTKRWMYKFHIHANGQGRLIIGMYLWAPILPKAQSHEMLRI